MNVIFKFEENELLFFTSRLIYNFMKFVILSFLPPATKLGQGYIFTGVCDSVHGRGGGVPASRGCLLGGGGCLVPGELPCPGGLVETPLGWLLLRAVRILLECILVKVCTFNSS